MANIDITRVEGFDELNRKLKLLTDRVKRSEVLKIFRRLAKPVVSKYKSNLPSDKGVLRVGVGVKSVPASRVGGNPVISILPSRRGKVDPFYRFMVVPEGTKLGSRKRGSRRGRANVVPIGRDKTLNSLKSGLVEYSGKETASYVQKQIDRLSK